MLYYDHKRANLLLVIAVATAAIYLFAIDNYYESNKDDPELFMPKMEKSVYESKPYPTTEET